LKSSTLARARRCVIDISPELVSIIIASTCVCPLVALRYNSQGGASRIEMTATK
jgi:hypothetical protein